VSAEALPDFERPPVVQIIASVQFLPLPQFGMAEILTVAREMDGWDVLDAPAAIPPMAEPPPGGEEITTINFGFGVAPLRLILHSREGTWLTQLQQDRIAIHEQRGEARPSFSHVKPKLLGEVVPTASAALGRSILEEEHRGEYVELVYENTICSAAGGWSGANELDRVLQLVSAEPTDPLHRSIEALSMGYAMVLEDEDGLAGRLRVQAESAHVEDRRPALHLRLISRRLVRSSNVSDVLDACHRDIVMGFTAATTPSMHEVWGRFR